jgi:hypothetical protein
MKPLNILCSKNPVFGVLKLNKNIENSVLWRIKFIL